MQRHWSTTFLDIFRLNKNLEQLDYGAESRCKVVSSSLASPSDDWKTLSVNPAVNGYLFRIRDGYGSERRGMGSAFHQLSPRYSGTLTPTAPAAIRLWETFTVYLQKISILMESRTYTNAGCLLFGSRNLSDNKQEESNRILLLGCNFSVYD